MTSERRRPFVASLPFDDARHLAAHRFLVDEAAMLDAGEWERWLDLLTDDVRYHMPVRVTTSAAAGWDTSDSMAHFDEDRFSLQKRVERLRSEHAWTEDPPSRTRHLVTNVRTHDLGPGRLGVGSALLLFRSRGDVRAPELVCAGRDDILVSTPHGWRLAERQITVDEAVLRTQNLAILL